MLLLTLSILVGAVSSVPVAAERRSQATRYATRQRSGRRVAGRLDQARCEQHAEHQIPDGAYRSATCEGRTGSWAASAERRDREGDDQLQWTFFTPLCGRSFVGNLTGEWIDHENEPKFQ